MIFNSIQFAFFFTVVTGLYFILPARFGWMILLAASCFFYMSIVPWYILILAFMIVVDYFIALQIEKISPRAKKILLIFSIFVNIGTLFFFKYFNFFNETVASLAQLINWNYSVQVLKILLPIGLSFHTFQSLSYIIEVYRGKFKAERHFGVYALYVMFFPQLVAGPIERPQHMLPQFHLHHRFNYDRFVSGLQLMGWGLIKKVIIADRLAVIVDHIYGNLHESSGIVIIVAVVFFAFQLYADFSGYTDIAIGSARMLGFDLSPNFNHPYFATSVADFWRRWHISLSNWIRDYVYYPLALSAKKSSRAWLYMTLFVTFLASGLWHGAGWTFITMGALFGFFVVVGMATKKYRIAFVHKLGLLRAPWIYRILQSLFVFALVCVSWVFFRAPSMIDAIYIVTHMYTPSSGTFGVPNSEMILSLVLIASLMLFEFVQERRNIGSKI